ncbi:M56 family metallopeptidase [Myroides sp. WP-1]|uniref:M56 family metallopeptidase n=1 Tax=Myroides sp. WP-1 TaxID=2759944 RepID=UPI0015FBEFA2|nr:M56 family metallopeptidase [Myroides sp. WP-1]MBB1139770.1 TonB-dependent receptor plug domain-containing protein [Myroides sp. WP-1]
MHSFVEYLLKVNGLLVIVLAFYYLVLRKETFFSAIRYYFLVGIGLSFILPLLRFTQTVYVEQHIDWSALLQQGNEDLLVEEQLSWINALDWQTILTYLVLTISSVLGFLFVAKVIRLTRYVKQLPLWANHAMVKIDGTTQEAYSFWKWIVLPTQDRESETLSTIIQHEQVHVQEKHSIDLLLISGLRCIFWFNPLLILLEQVIRLNLEYIVDQKVSAVQNSYEYQMTLVRFEQTKGSAMSLVNSFGSSDLKKRIIKLNQPKSKNMKKSKFVLCLPLVVGFFLLFQVKTKAEVVFVEQEQIGSNTEQESEKRKHTAEVTGESEGSLPMEQQETAAVKKKEENKSQGEKSAEKKAGSVQIITRDEDGNIVYQTDDATDEQLAKYNIVRVDDGKGALKQFKIVTSENGSRHSRIYINGKDYSIDELLKESQQAAETSTTYFHTNKGEELSEEVKKAIEEAKKSQEEAKRAIESSKRQIEESKKAMLESRKVMEESKEARARAIKDAKKALAETREVREQALAESRKAMEESKEARKQAIEAAVEARKQEQQYKKWTVVGGTMRNEESAWQKYIIDGVHVKDNTIINSLDPNDIEQVHVIKGEKAVKEYGEDAKNGVILVTTKKK